MPKPKFDDSKTKNLPDVAELKFEGWGDTVVLLEQLHELQQQVGKAPDEKKGKEGSGLLAQIHMIKSQLSSYMAVAGVDGLRHNNLVFSDCWIEGTERIDVKLLQVELAQAGVDLTIIKACVKAATKKGDGYVRRQLRDLNKNEEE